MFMDNKTVRAPLPSISLRPIRVSTAQCFSSSLNGRTLNISTVAASQSSIGLGRFSRPPAPKQTIFMQRTLKVVNWAATAGAVMLLSLSVWPGFLVGCWLTLTFPLIVGLAIVWLATVVVGGRRSL